MPANLPQPLESIPDETTVRRRLADLAHERTLLRQLLRLARNKREAEDRLRQRQEVAHAN